MACGESGKNKAGRVLLQEIQEKVGADDKTKIHGKMHAIFDFSNITCQEEPASFNTRYNPTFETDWQAHEAFHQTTTHDEEKFIQDESSFEGRGDDEASGFKDENDDSSTPEKKVPNDVDLRCPAFELGLIICMQAFGDSESQSWYRSSSEEEENGANAFSVNEHDHRDVANQQSVSDADAFTFKEVISRLRKENYVAPSADLSEKIDLNKDVTSESGAQNRQNASVHGQLPPRNTRPAVDFKQHYRFAHIERGGGASEAHFNHKSSEPPRFEPSNDSMERFSSNLATPKLQSESRTDEGYTQSMSMNQSKCPEHKMGPEFDTIEKILRARDGFRAAAEYSAGNEPERESFFFPTRQQENVPPKISPCADPLPSHGYDPNFDMNPLPSCMKASSGYMDGENVMYHDNWSKESVTSHRIFDSSQESLPTQPNKDPTYLFPNPSKCHDQSAAAADCNRADFIRLSHGNTDSLYEFRCRCESSLGFVLFTSR
jgi:hypothetical protein